MRVILLATLCATFGFNSYAGDRATIRASQSADLGDDKEPTQQDIEAKLKAVKVSFNWNDAALADVAKDIAQKTGVKITISPKANAGNISLKVTNMNAKLVLEWVEKLASVKVTYEKGGVVLK